jgi:hypothetical protein
VLFEQHRTNKLGLLLSLMSNDMLIYLNPLRDPIPMSTSTQPTGRDVWRFVRDERASMKKAASILGISVGRAFELLAEERSRREAEAHRLAACSSITPAKSRR